MKRKIFSILFALVLVVSFSLIPATSVSAATLNVPSGPYPTIQAAVNAASPDDTILVAAGNYDENVATTKAVKLIGAGSGVTSIAPASGRPVTLLGWSLPQPAHGSIDGFIIKGFTLVTADASSHAFLAGSGTADGSYYTTNLVLNDIVVNGGEKGIGLNAVQGVALIDVHISNISGSGEGALELTGVSDLNFLGGSIEDNDIGVRLQISPVVLPCPGQCYGPNFPIDIHFSSLTGNGVAVENQDISFDINATGNWWGDASGPSDFGPGTGDPVSNYVDFSPWIDRSYDSVLMLENKDPSNWSIKGNDMIGGVLLYNSSGPEFEYFFLAKVPTPGNYSLIYYADYSGNRYGEWGGDNPGALIATFTTGSGDIGPIAGSVDLGISLPCPPDANISEHGYCGTPDFYVHCHGAKIWLVPTSALTGGNLPVTAWPPTDNWLFETDLIWYHDTDVTLAAVTPQRIAFTVHPNSIDFGTVMPGQNISGQDINVRNVGTVAVNVDAELQPGSTPVFEYLFLSGQDRPNTGKWSPTDLGTANMLPTNIRVCSTELQVPATYSATGLESAKLIFWVTTVVP